MSDKPYFHELDSKSIETRVHMLKLPDGTVIDFRDPTTQLVEAL